MLRKLFLGLAAASMTSMSLADGAISNYQLEGYRVDVPGNFVWIYSVDKNASTECAYSTVKLELSTEGGKAAYASLSSAFAQKNKVDINYTGQGYDCVVTALLHTSN